MPLSKPVERDHLHTREIVCRGYQRADGLWDIEGSIIDSKTYSFDNQDRDGVAAGEPVHHMAVRLTVDDDLIVQAAEATTLAGPYGLCGDITPRYGDLKGARIGAGWRKDVFKRVGGTGGCTHITDLLSGPLAVTAYQTIIPRRRRLEEDAGSTERPRVLDTCHALSRSSPVVARRWPEFHEPADAD